MVLSHHVYWTRRLVLVAAVLTLVLGLIEALVRPLPAARAATLSTCDRMGTISVAGRTYIVQNNIWNDAATGQQCISVDDGSGYFRVTTATSSVWTGGAPASYPSIFKGCHWTNCTSNSGLPLQVSAVSSAPSSWSVSTAGGIWNVSYDIWFNTTPTVNGNPDGLELMIWLNHQGGIQPIGSKVGNVSFSGASWDVWVGNVGWNVVSYIRTSPTSSVSFDLKPFMSDAQGRGRLPGHWYLVGVEAGFEIWQGGAGLTSHSFSVSFNGGGGGGGGATISPGAWYYVVNQNSGKCVDNAGWGTSNGSIVQQWSCNHGSAQTNQMWQFVATDGGYYKVVSRQAPIVWDVSNWGTGNGSKVHLWSYGGGTNQQWRAESLGNGSYRFVARNSGRCLDVPSASTADGVQLQIWDCNGTGAQAFKLIQK